jgi:hypothetical protein
MLSELHELQQALALHSLPPLVLLLLLHQVRHVYLLGGHLLWTHLLRMGLGVLLRRLLLALLLWWVVWLCRRGGRRL